MCLESRYIQDISCFKFNCIAGLTIPSKHRLLDALSVNGKLPSSPDGYLNDDMALIRFEGEALIF
jgi:hypothetical protein